MKIEIVGFYELERNDEKQLLKGTLHIYLIDEQIDIRGCYVIRRKDAVLIYLPHSVGIDEETKAKIKYPIFQFTSMEKNKALIAEIRRLGVPFIKEEVLGMKKKVLKKPRSTNIKSEIFSTRR